jgi:hypothetical protein
MGLLDGTTQQQYYQSNNHGDYQFTSLKDIINQFMVAYVGEEGIINKVSRVDVAFHAQRALQELSFDTFKSIKSQEIVLPSSGIMILPHDYVNYTRVLWSDSAGIKHPIYPTRDTQNPFQINQNEDGSYQFTELEELIWNGDFEINAWDNGTLGAYNKWWPINGWSADDAGIYPPGNHGPVGEIAIESNKLQFKHQSVAVNQYTAGNIGYAALHASQSIDTSDKSFLNLSANGEAVDSAGGAAGVLRIGIISSTLTSTTQLFYPGYTYVDTWGLNTLWPNINFGIWSGINNTFPDMFNFLQDENGNPAYLEWMVGNNTSAKSLTGIDVTNESGVEVVVISYHHFTTAENGLQNTNNIDNISVTNQGVSGTLSTGGGSSTWSNYQSNTPSENANQDYDTDIYDLNQGQRYGLDPQHAQTNGSFYIDNLRGTINFSPNMVGKTIVLDYISDSLGTDEEMVVHKFAEEAMYKWILHDVANGRIRTQQLTPRLRKEKIAAVRQAKLRLSNIKPEELTQTLRGKSKQIKH